MASWKSGDGQCYDRVSGWVRDRLTNVIVKLVAVSPIYGTYPTYLYRGEIINLLSTMDI